ncbi:MAG TPA: hypothetical protein VLE96_02090, partial [Chlamydiales bacterium]|nr:hypothetical protein [Chlamydiales bacterium]
VSHALLRQPPHELLEIKTLLGKLLPESKNPATAKDLIRIEEILSTKIDREFLQQLAIGLKDESGKPMEIEDVAIDLILNLAERLEEGIIAETSDWGNEETVYQLTPEFLKTVEDAKAILDILITNNQGSLIKISTFVQNKILDQQLHAEEGLLEKIGNTFVNTVVNPVMERIENLPAKWVNSVLNPSANSHPVSDPNLSPVQPEPVQNSDPSTEANSVSMGKYLKVAWDMFENLSRFAGEAVTRKLIEQFSSLLLWVLKTAEENTENKEEYKQAYAAIKSLLPDVQKIVNPKTQQEVVDATVCNLITLFKKSFSIINQHQLFINGKPVPRIGGTEEIVTNSIGQHFNNLKKLDPPSSVSFTDCDYQKLIEIEQREFIRNTTHFATLKTIYESKFLCGIKPKDAKFYYQLMDDALKADPQHPFRSLRIQFFKKIDEAYSNKEISFFAKISAKASYPILSPLLHYFIDRFSNRLITSIKKTSDLGFKEIIDRSIEHFTGYLEVLGSVFDRVSERKFGTRTLPKMIEQELQLADCNEERTPDKLYAEFTRKAVDRFAPRIKWSTNLSQWIENKKYTPSSLPKKTWNLSLELASSALKGCISLPQMVLNKALMWGVKKALVKNELVKSLVNNSSSSVMDKNGYTHALNCVIYEQLQKILELMQIAYSKKRSRSETPLKDVDSIAKKEQFTALVKNLFEVLPKSKCSTRHELEQFLKKKSLSASIKEGVDDFMVQDTVEAAIKLIKIAIDSVMEKDQMNKRILEFMTMANKSFKVGANISLEEYKAKETAITDQCDKIINLALDMSLEDKVDFSVDKLRNQSHQFIQKIKDAVKQFCESNIGTAQELASIVHWDHFKSMDLLEQMKTHSKEFQQMRMNAMFSAKASNLDSETKKKLDVISTELANQFSELDDQLIQMRSLETDNNTRQKTIQELKTLQQLFNSINSKTLFVTTSIASLQSCQMEIQKMEQIIQNLPNIERLQESFVPHLKQQVIAARNALNELLEARKTLDVLIPELDLSLSNSLINHLKEQKRVEIIDPFTTNKSKNFFSQISELIKKIPSQNKQEELVHSLELVKQSKDIQDLDRHCTEFNVTFRALYDMEKHRLEFVRESIKKTSELGVQSIQTSGETDPQSIQGNVQKIHGHLQNYRQKLQEISTCADALKDLGLLNIKILDENMVKDFGKEMGYHHVKKRIDGLVNFIRKPYNVSGFYRHGLIIPFLKRQF